MGPNIYTVAEKAGVSIATVSRTLSHSPQVKEETKAKVLQVIEELGYQPSASARGLALNRTETLALVFPDISGPFYSEVIRGVENEASKHSYNVVIYGTHGKESSARFLRLLTTKVDGFILMTRSVEDKYIFYLHERGIPFVLLDRKIDGIQVDCILTNNAQGAYKATEHLLLHNHQRVAFISGPMNSPDSRERFNGYRQALQDHGILFLPRLVERGDFRQPSGYQAMRRLLEQPDPPSAVLAANDEMAIGAIEAVRERGQKVPDDIAIVGFDDIDMASYVQPSLSTVRQPIYKFGTLAVQMLIRRIGGVDAEAEAITLPTKLVIRRSCGCGGSDS